MKIAIYAICKNESAFVKRWINSMKEADGIFVLDTGSTDNTVELLKAYNATVNVAKVEPWRFDEARNLSLTYVPKDYDICVCTDLDEVFEKGWRNELEKNWKIGITTRARYKYTWSFNDDGSAGTTFWYDKIHSRFGYKWVHPVHEILEKTTPLPEIYTTINTIQLNHYPDKTKSRGQYLELLELSVKECPNNDRNMHYLGREYMFNKMWDKCIDALTRHLDLPTATWKDERSASMRYIARAYCGKNDFYNAEIWLYRAIAQAPYLREGYVESAQLAYYTENWEKVYFMVNEALKIKTRPETYINEAFCWNEYIYDIGSIASFKLGLYKKSLEFAQTAHKINPNDKRIQENIALIKNFVN